jgi:Tfp pilus assembly protein PilX
MAAKQRGFATLTMALLLLTVMLWVTLSSDRFKLLEQRLLRNHLASQQAAFTADSALQRVETLLAADLQQLNRGFSGTIARIIADTIGDGASYQATLSSEHFSNGPRGSVDVVTVQVTAQSADGRARRRVGQQLAVMAMITAQLPRLADAQFTRGLAASDWLNWLFEIPEANWPQLKAMANTSSSNCNGLGPSSDGLIWVDGPCWLAPGLTIGSAEQPVLLVIQDADLSLASSAELVGLAVLFNSPGALTEPRLQLAEGALIDGMVLANSADVAVVEPQLRRSASILATLARSDALKRLYRVAGSWHDF